MECYVIAINLQDMSIWQLKKFSNTEKAREYIDADSVRELSYQAQVRADNDVNDRLHLYTDGKNTCLSSDRESDITLWTYATIGEH